MQIWVVDVNNNPIECNHSLTHCQSVSPFVFSKAIQGGSTISFFRWKPQPTVQSVSYKPTDSCAGVCSQLHAQVLFHSSFITKISLMILWMSL